MSGYIPFTDAQKERAASVDLEAFLQSRGETLLPSGKEKRLAIDHSITVGGNSWYDHAAERGGGPVSFVREQYGLSYPEAMQLLLGGEAELVPLVRKRKNPLRKPFVRPPENHNMRRAYAYLVRSRGISREVVNVFAKAGLLYEDAEYHNCVFIGKDEMGIARHTYKRSTNSFGKAFRLNVEGSDPRYSFHHIGTDDMLYVFVAPIDLLSYISLHSKDWQRHSYVACCGVSFQPVQKMLERMLWYLPAAWSWAMLGSSRTELELVMAEGNRIKGSAIPVSTPYTARASPLVSPDIWSLLGIQMASRLASRFSTRRLAMRGRARARRAGSIFFMVSLPSIRGRQQGRFFCRDDSKNRPSVFL